MRFAIFISVACSVLLSCNTGNNSEKHAEVNQHLPDAVSEKLLLREKVYAQLLQEQLQYDSAVIKDSTRKDTPVDCGTRLTIEQYDEIATFFDNVCTPEIQCEDTTTIPDYPVQFYIIVNKDNKAPVTKPDIRAAFQELQQRFSATRIKFTLKGIDTIKAGDLYDFNCENEFRITRRRKLNMITVFVFNSIVDRNAHLNGYTYMKKGDDFLMLTGNAIRNKTTFPHEMGHYFLLYHTHGKTNTGTTDEMVERTGCSCTGDDVCDTPADPNLLNAPLKQCVYIGVLTDTDGKLYKPDPTNIMSYAQLCRKDFSKGQYNRMRLAALTYRHYLLEN